MSDHTTYYKLHTTSPERGVTLVEVMIYILVFSFVMSAVLISVNQILSYSYTASSKSSVEQEAEFVLAKIGWLLNGASVDLPAANSSGGTLTVTKATGQLSMALAGDNITVNDGVVTHVLNSSWIRFGTLSFDRFTDSGSGTNIVKASFYANGKKFEITKTIR